MVGLSAIDILYLILLIGSLAFGLEAMLIGFGGKLTVLYRGRRVKTLLIGLDVGLAIVVPAVITSVVLALEPIYFCALVLAYMLVASGIIRAFGARYVRTPPRPLPPQNSELEVVDMLRRRGFGKLVKKKKKSG